MTSAIPIFDGHNDVLLRLVRGGVEGAERRFLDGEAKGHLDLPRARAGGFAGGLFAMYVPSRSGLDFKALRGEAYALQLPPEVPLADTWTLVGSQAGCPSLSPLWVMPYQPACRGTVTNPCVIPWYWLTVAEVSASPMIRARSGWPTEE